MKVQTFDLSLNNFLNICHYFYLTVTTRRANVKLTIHAVSFSFLFFKCDSCAAVEPPPSCVFLVSRLRGRAWRSELTPSVTQDAAAPSALRPPPVAPLKPCLCLRSACRPETLRAPHLVSRLLRPEPGPEPEPEQTCLFVLLHSERST